MVIALTVPANLNCCQRGNNCWRTKTVSNLTGKWKSWWTYFGGLLKSIRSIISSSKMTVIYFNLQVSLFFPQTLTILLLCVWASSQDTSTGPLQNWSLFWCHLDIWGQSRVQSSQDRSQCLQSSLQGDHIQQSCRRTPLISYWDWEARVGVNITLDVCRRWEIRGTGKGTFLWSG